MPKLLYVSKIVPRPNAPEAGSKISYNMLEDLTGRYEVTLLAFANGQEELRAASELRAKLPGGVVQLPCTMMHKCLNTLAGAGHSLITTLRYDVRFQSALIRLLAQQDPDVILVEFTQMARYINVIRSAAPRAVTILYEHDVSTQMATRRAASAKGFSRFFWSREVSLLQQEEPQLCNGFDLVCAPTQKDVELLASLGVSRDRLLRVVNFALRNDDAGEWTDPGQRSPTLLFVGALARVENAEAVRRLTTKILPALRGEFPDLTVRIVGGGEGALASELRGVPGVVFTGFVPSILQVARQCHVAVFPLTLGAGLKIKALEAMAWGMPVVTTSIGAEGIGAVDGSHMDIAEDDAELVQRIGHLLRDPSRRSQMGRAGQELCRREFESNRNMAGLYGRIEHLLRERRSAGD